MSELCRRQIIRQQQIMKKSVLTVLIALLPLAAIAQPPSINEDGKKMEKEKMETKDYLPEVHGTIRAKYEYQTTMGAGRFEVRQCTYQRNGQRTAHCCLQSRDRPLRRRPNQDAGCLRPAFPDKKD